MYFVTDIFVFSNKTRWCQLYHLLGRFLPVHEPLGDDARGEDLVALSELLEEDPVGEPQSADPDSLQDSVATELIEDQLSGDLPGLLLVVRDDATDEVGLSGAQRVHQLVELLLREEGERQLRDYQLHMYYNAFFITCCISKSFHTTSILLES